MVTKWKSFTNGYDVDWISGFGLVCIGIYQHMSVTDDTDALSTSSGDTAPSQLATHSYMRMPKEVV